MNWEDARKLERQTARKRRTHFGIEIIVGPIERPCDWQPWAGDPRYERCVRHGEVRKAVRP